MIRNVVPADRLSGVIIPPPDKSVSHRAALFAALHESSSEITNFSPAADPQSTLSCLRGLGVVIEKKGDSLKIKGVGRDGFSEPQTELDCGNSGTTLRLLSGIAGGAGISCTLKGDESLSSRTMKRIIEPLGRMGIEIKARGGDYAPLRISRAGQLKPLHYELPIPSAQLKSCILLAGLFGDKSTTVVENIPSRDHTERLLNLPVSKENNSRVIYSHRDIPIPPQSYRIPNDFSAAAFWLVAGCIHPDASIQLNGVGVNPTRTAAMHILQEMGAGLKIENERLEGLEPVADLLIKNGPLRAIHIGGDRIPNCIDEVPILGVAMLFADGVSRISGAEELRHKETDRLAAMAEMFEKAGADFTEYEDGFEIHGRADFHPSPAVYNSYHDHRIAMAAAILGLMGKEESSVEHAGCTAVSYPAFWDDMVLLTN